ncbi:MAG TPA: endolytic transglycosylase MltG, partial [Vicinamibacterales bacterium]|nr:endolytic transglycosylase MltG [Vicinamibacterales bacterium]
DVIAKIARGEVFLRPITFPEGLSIIEMARLFETRGFGAASAFEAAARNARLVANLDPQARDLEGYLFPETYPLPRRTDANTLVRTMVSRFEQVFDAAARAAASERGLSVREVVTLASLVEKETAKPEERPTVAAVYLNRLKIGMGLQCDPTVIYALQKAGRYTGNLTRADMAFDSPYNTYKNAGLPPGPIAAPGRASLEAVLRPAEVDYLYFVSRNDGSHVFSRTYAEHQAKVREFQVEYFKER